MYGKALEVSGLKVSASIDAGIDIELVQVAPVVVTCVMDGINVSRVHADEGIEFASEGSLLTLSYMRCADVTSLLDRKEWARKLRDATEADDAMTIHTTSVKGKF